MSPLPLDLHHTSLQSGDLSSTVVTCNRFDSQIPCKEPEKMQVHSRSSAVEKFAARPVAGEVRVMNQRHSKWRSCSQAQVGVSLLHQQETDHLDRPEPLLLKVAIRTRVLQDVRQHKLV